MMMRKWCRALLVLMAFSLIMGLTIGCRVEQESTLKDNTNNNNSTSSKQPNLHQDKEPTDTASDKGMKDDTFNRKTPQLLGLSLTSKEQDISKQWGQPQSQFIIDDTSRIEVWEYDGFSIGCTEQGEIIFIDVSGMGQATGLEGLKVGDHQSSAERVLGKPDKNTGYVWSYHCDDDTLLRLDLDPKTQLIQSVKLFSHTA